MTIAGIVVERDMALDRARAAESLNEDYKRRLDAVNLEFIEKGKVIDDLTLRLDGLLRTLSMAHNVGVAMSSLFPHSGINQAWLDFLDRVLVRWADDTA